MSTIKTFATRDSATSLLRKMGIDKTDYNKFISITADDRFAVAVSLAEKQLNGEKVPDKKEVAEKAKLESRAEELRTELKTVVKKAKQKEATVSRRKQEWTVVNEGPKPTPGIDSMSGYCRALIAAGYNNGEIFVGLQKYFGATQKQHHYPAWYRSVMRNEAKKKAAKGAN